MNRSGAWEDPPGTRRLLGQEHLGTGHGRLAQRRPPDPPLGHAGARASDETALTVAEGHGIRGAGRSRGAQRRSRQHVCPRPSVRCRRRNERTRPACRVAVARAAPHLRQRHAPRGDDRGRLRARASGPRCSTGWTSWNGCSTARPNTAISPSPPSGAVVPMTMVRDSTNSPLRWRPSPMPVPAPRALTATDGGWTAITAAANWFLGDNDGGVVMWDPATGGAFDGLERERRQSQPGHRVDARPPLDPAARTVSRERLAMIGHASSLARRSPVHIAADKSRVVTRLFVPGHEGFDQQESRSSAVLQRVLALSDDEVQRSYDDVRRAVRGSTSRPDRDVPPARRRALRSPRPGTPPLSDPPPAAWCDLHE